MPTINYGKTVNQIVWDETDWLSGLHPQYSLTSFTTQYPKGDKFMWLQSQFDPYRFLGYVAPSYDNTAVTNSSAVDAKLLNVSVKSSFGYFSSNNAKLHRIDLSTNTFSNTGDWPHSITAHGGHNTPVANDVVNYTAKVGGTSATRWFYSWSDNTDWDVGTYDFASTFDDDFMSTAPATPLASPYLAGGKGFPHPLIVGHDDIMYMGDRNFVHGYDGANAADNDGKFFPAVLTLPNSYTITSFAKYDPRSLVIFAYNNDPSNSGQSGFFSGQATAFFWDYLSLDPYNVVQLNDNYVDAGFSYNGTVGCFTSGRQLDFQNNSRISKVQLYDGNQFKQLVSYLGDAPTKGGVDINGEQISWLCNFGSSAILQYSWGNQFGQTPVLNLVNSVLYSSSYAAGVLRSLTTTLQIASAGTSSAAVVSNQSDRSTFNAGTQIRTSLVRPQFPSGFQGRLTAVTLEWAKTATGGRQVSIGFFDQENTQTTIISSQTVVSSLRTRVTLKSNGDPLPAFDGLSLFVAYGTGDGATDAPIVSRVLAEYEPISITTT